MAQRSGLFYSVLALGTFVVLCAGGGAAYMLTRPPVFRNHGDTVKYALAQRGVPYEQITFEQTWQDSVDYRSYGSHIRVRLRSGRVVTGRVGCEYEQSSCFLELRDLGIAGQPLEELTPTRPWPLLEWARNALDRLTSRGLPR